MEATTPGLTNSATIQQLKRLYTVIIISIISFLIAQQFLLHLSTSKSKAFAKQLNVAGRQRMLSQKIAKLSLLHEKDDMYTTELLNSLKAWNDDYHDLLYGNENRGIASMSSPDIFQRMLLVDFFHKRISEDVNRLIKKGTNHKAAISSVLHYEKLFLLYMEEIVHMVEASAENSVDNITYIEYIMSMIAFLIILLEIYFVFKPTRSIIINQENELKQKIKDLTDSMVYAKKVQDTILPEQHTFLENFSESFVLYLPKDIIAGDFYLVESLTKGTDGVNVSSLNANDDVILFAVCDCTGHGIPGAMVSIICHNAIDKAVKELKLSDPAAILNKVNELVRKAFSKGESAIMDGMDVSICCLNRSTKKLCWAGANIPLWIVRNNPAKTEIIELKPDKQPIGRHVTNKPFTNHIIELRHNDSVYLFSDGYSDQFGGEKGKKFKSRQLQQLLIDNSSEDLSVTKKILHNTLKKWQGNHEQVDDITILGIRL
ncbi:MAG: SpoIIE family protein phosphatase [Bacteroidota bacterium]